MNNDMLIYAITALYTVCNFARLLAYAPQIAAVARDRSGAYGISLLSWSVWASTHAVTAIYCALVIKDGLLAITMICNTTAASLILVIALLKRREFKGRTLVASARERAGAPICQAHV